MRSAAKLPVSVADTLMAMATSGTIASPWSSRDAQCSRSDPAKVDRGVPPAGQQVDRPAPGPPGKQFRRPERFENLPIPADQSRDCRLRGRSGGSLGRIFVPGQHDHAGEAGMRGQPFLRIGGALRRGRPHVRPADDQREGIHHGAVNHVVIVL